MSYVLGFLPWIVFFVLSGSASPSRHMLLIATGVSFVVALIMLIPSAVKHRVSSLDIGALVFFPIMAIITVILAPETTEQWAAAIGSAALAIAVGIGIAVGKPFTLTYAKAGVPEALWTNPYFIAGCRRLAVGWFYGFVLMTISSIVGAFFTPDSVPSYIFNWVIPIVVVVLVVRWQIGEIHKMQAAGQARAAAAVAQSEQRDHQDG